MLRQLVAIVLLGAITFAAYTISAASLEPTFNEWGKMSTQPQARALQKFNTTAAYLIDAQTFTQDFRDGVPAESAVIISDLNSSLTFGYSANKPLVSASLYKLFSATYVYKAIEAGDIHLDDRTSAGRVGPCLDRMITKSDNDCAIELSELIGFTEIDKLIKQDGYLSTTLDNYDEDGRLDGDKITTAADVGLLLKRLYSGELLNEENSAAFLQLLAEQEVNDRQPEIIPAGVEFWHKTGNLLETAHDAGFIVKKDQVFLYVIMTDNWEQNAFFESQQYFQPFFEGVLEIFELDV